MSFDTSGTSLPGCGQVCRKTQNCRCVEGPFFLGFYSMLVQLSALDTSEDVVQVLRYAPGEDYKVHHDSNGRLVTVLIYLAGVTFRV